MIKLRYLGCEIQLVYGVGEKFEVKIVGMECKSDFCPKKNEKRKFILTKRCLSYEFQGSIKRTPKMPICVEELLKGVEGGERDYAGFAIGRHFSQFQTDVYSLLSNWNTLNRPPLPESKVTDIAQQVGKGVYKIGCSEPILKKNCFNRFKCPWRPKKTN